MDACSSLVHRAICIAAAVLFQGATKRNLSAFAFVVVVDDATDSCDFFVGDCELLVRGDIKEYDVPLAT